MPGKHDPRKRFITFSISRELYYQIKQAAEEREVDRTAFVVDVLKREMTRLGIKLKPEYAAAVTKEAKNLAALRRMSWTSIESRGEIH